MNLNDKRLGWYLLKILKIAILARFKEPHFGDEESNDERFFLDVDLGEQINEEDLGLLAEGMREILERNLSFRQVDLKSIDLVNQPLQQKLLERADGKRLLGVLVEEEGKGKKTILLEDISKVVLEEEELRGKDLTNFLLNELSGAFFLGDKENQQLTRIAGFAQETAIRFEESLKLLEERRENDHKRIGRRQNIFINNQFFGQGFIAWLEDGMIIKNKINRVVKDLERRYDFDEVLTPIFGHKSLYEISGHLSHYQESMFPVLKVEDEELILRPMTCPHHLILFNTKRWSYRDLPKRFCESSRLFRYEASGALSGLERVRAMELTEGHILLREDQIEEEIKRCFKMVNEAINVFDITIDHIALSTRSEDDKIFHGSKELWEESESLLGRIVKELGVDYKIDKGGAAFYGPKIDIQIRNLLGRVITLSTIQLDYYLPQRFRARYTDADGKERTCVLIHRGLLGTYERFISILLEQYKGDLPLWFNPRQIMIIPTTLKDKEIIDYSKSIFKRLKEEEIEVAINLGEENLNKKILLAQKERFKLTAVIGRRELETGSLSIRELGTQESNIYQVEELIKMIKTVEPR